MRLFYPTVAIAWVLGNLATGLYLLGAATANINVTTWILLWFAAISVSLLTFFWLRRFNLVEHERRELGMAGMVLFLAAIPVYVSAALSFITGRPLAYAVTAKGDLTSPDRLRTFQPHLLWITGGLILIFAGMLVRPVLVHPYAVLWAMVTIVVAAFPIVVYVVSRRRKRAAAQAV